jgi:hypothetical protein
MRSSLGSVVFGVATLGACGGPLLRGGTGGTGGAGGAAGGGSGGAAGSSVCSALFQEYHQAVLDAQSCNLGTTGQCQYLVDSDLPACGPCPTYVADTSKLSPIEDRWHDAGCDLAPPCDAIVACPTAQNDVCLSVGGRGVCSSPPADVCADLASQYQAALTTALSCQSGAANQCAQLVVSALTSCPNVCSIYITDATTLLAIQQSWTQANCAYLVSEDCPIYPCAPPVSVSCTTVDAGGAFCLPDGYSATN